MKKPSKHATRRYDVGFGKPPRHAQFQPGQSGNPAGRPRGLPTVDDIFVREAARHVRVEINGRVESVSKLEAVVRRLFNMAAGGDLRAMNLALRYLSRLGMTDDGSAVDGNGNAAADFVLPDEETLRRMIYRFAHLMPN